MSEQQFKGISWTFRQTATPVSDPLNETYQQLERAETLRMQGQIEGARAICETLVRQYPDYFGALYTLGLIYGDKEQYPQALGFLVRAAMLNPRSWRAWTALSAVYFELGANEMAAHSLEQAIRINPEDPSILLTLGEIYRDEREYELARDAFRRSFELDPSIQAGGAGLASCCAQLGQYAEAAEILHGLINRGMRSTVVLNELNDMPSSFVRVDVLRELEHCIKQPSETQPEFENTMAFVRAAALHKTGRHAEAWAQLESANRTLHVARKREAEELADTQRANLAQLKEKRIDVAGDTVSGTMSLFILGPSRSGKTTIETLVGTLPGVKRGYENPGVEKAIRRTFQGAGLLTTAMFEVLPPRLDSNCRDIYFEELALRAGSAKVFTNTHPVRLHDVARIAAAFPNVRFVFIKRNLDDNMLRIFMRKYAVGNPYAYDLGFIRNHILWYQEMIDVLADKLPDITRVIRYEDVVADPAAALRTMADLCGLPMHHGPLPPIGDDRGCAEPYRPMLAMA